MQTFVFWSKNDSLNIYPKSALSIADQKTLKASGFSRVAFETHAENEELALEQYFSHFDANTHELRVFTHTHVFLILLGLGLFFTLWLAK